MLLEEKIIEEIPEYLQDQLVKEVNAGIYMSSVMSESVGCAFTLTGGEPVPHMNPEIKSKSPIRGMKAIDLAKWAKSDIPLEVTLGYAAINSLLNQKKELNLYYGNIMKYLKTRFSGKKIRMIGYFAFHDEMNSWTNDFKIIENKPVTETINYENGKEELSGADLVIVTGVTLLNRTFEDVIKRCRDSFVVLFGPTPPFSKTLLDMGVDMIGNFVPTDVNDYYNSVTEGRVVLSFRSCKLAIMSKETVVLPEGGFLKR